MKHRILLFFLVPSFAKKLGLTIFINLQIHHIMATPNTPPPKTLKRPNSEINNKTFTGYIHNTSPVKRARNNNDYFEATLQTSGKEYQRMVCFSKRMHQTFKTFEEKKSPVKINKVQTSQNWHDSSKEDIKITPYTTMETSNIVPTYKYKKPLELDLQHALDTTVTDFINTIPSTEKKKINLTAHVTRVVEEETQQTLSYTTVPINKKSFTIADQNSCLTLTAWGNSIPNIQTEHTYKFQFLSITNYNDVKHLQTTPTTIIEEVATMENPNNESSVTNNNTKIQGACCECVQCDTSYNCCSCKDTVNKDLLATVTFKCPHCNMRQNSTSAKEQSELN
ncbi:uncharacterized protein LOC135489687 [Lineus longissimus]|uniref:uncharacterized protein LOC135489687 n=1 Tax=Lineus longissimus TaxID=88925 RepID=UPI00315CF769